MARDCVNSALARLSQGEPMRSVFSTGWDIADFYEALEADAELAARYTRVTEARAELMADEILRIADDPTIDARDKDVRIKARQWLSAKSKPRKFGERLEVHQTGHIDLRAALALADARVAQMTPRCDHDVTPRLEAQPPEPIEADWSPAREADVTPLSPSPGPGTAPAPSVD